VPIRLSERTLNGLTAAARPQYSREKVSNGIVHLGSGGFHRGHQAVYTDELLASGDTRWGITGASLRSRSVHDKLAPQDFLYTVQAQDERANSLRVIGSISNVLVLTQPGQLATLTKLIADPATQVVTLTITEKGYCQNHQGDLDETHPDIAHDLRNPHVPRSAAGILALGLIQRMNRGAGPLTVLSCDNLVANGTVTRNVVESMVRQYSPETSSWLADNLSFPSSMVDRIVPRTNAEDIAMFEAKTGYTDTGLVICEPFSQWVIENRFAGSRPAWEVAGAQFVDKVAPFEQAKLRLLNATHSALAYLGLLAGYEHVHQAIADPALAGFIQRLMDTEIAPAIRWPAGMDPARYKASILKRFANSAIPYRTDQVAADGSQKLPQRIYPTIEQRLRDRASISGLCLVVAGWLRCLKGRADDAESISINDPNAQPIAQLSAQYFQAGDLVAAIASETAQFGDLAQHDEFLQTLTDALSSLQDLGSLASAQSFIADHA
jgi:fructuronate reductase